MEFNGIRLNGVAVLAPLAGISDSSFRMICKQYGAAVVFSEMVSSEGIVRNDARSLEYLRFQKEERPIAIQLFGANPEIMAEAAKIVSDKNPDFIDLNFGCPVKKIVKRGAGAAILKDLSLLQKITSSVTRVTSIPVFAKIRSGWNTSQINATEAAHMLEDCGIQAITVHPRTQSQYFKSCSDWQIINQVKQAVSIPVIGNGDIKKPEDAERMLRDTGCDLVMIGRGALGKPWFFTQVNDYLNNKTYSNITNKQKLETCLKHIKLVVAEKGEYRGLREMRKHLAWYFKGLPHSASFRASLFQINKITQIEEILINYFSSIVPEMV